MKSRLPTSPRTQTLWESPSKLSEDNTLFPLGLLERAVAKKVPAFINTDTCFTTDYKYLRPYTLSKKQLVQWGQILTEGTNTKFVNFVLQHPYGPGDRPTKFDGADKNYYFVLKKQKKDK